MRTLLCEFKTWIGVFVEYKNLKSTTDVKMDYCVYYVRIRV